MKIIEIIVGILSSIGLINFLNHLYLIEQQEYILHQVYLRVAMIGDLLWLFGCLFSLAFIVLKFDNK